MINGIWKFVMEGEGDLRWLDISFSAKTSPFDSFAKTLLLRWYFLLHSHEWPRKNFFLQYQYNIKQASNENKEKYQLRDYKLIQNQIL